jgi:hypothetical protein
MIGLRMPIAALTDQLDKHGLDLSGFDLWPRIFT